VPRAIAAASPRRGGLGASPSLSLFALAVLVLASGVAEGQVVPPPPHPRSAEVTRLARGSDPLQTLTVYRAQAGLAGDEKLACELALADAFWARGRRSEALSRWRTLLAEGVDTSSELLAAEGASLRAALLVPPREGQALRLVLRGAGTGPVRVGLYRVDPVRLRRALPRSRGLLSLLRAPPANALQRVGAWSSPAPAAGSPQISVSPKPLARGPYLLVLEARGVRVPFPILVPSAATLVRRGAGEGILWAVERQAPRAGQVIAGLEFVALDSSGRPQKTLGATGIKGAERGLLRYRSEAPWALAWREPGPGAGAQGGLVLVRLLQSRPPAAPSLGAWRSAARLEPGEPFVAWALERDPRRPWELRTPSGRTWVERTGNRADFDLRLPAWAPSGAWSVHRGGARAPLRLEPGHTPGLTLRAKVTRGVSAWQLALEGGVAGGYPLAGAEVAWRARLLPAEPVWSPSGERPLAPHAARLRAGPERLLGEARVRLDAAGRAVVALPRPKGEWGILLVEAHLVGPLRARARASEVEGPVEAVAVVPAQRLVASRSPIPVELRWIDREGRGKARAEFAVALEAGELSTQREVRADEKGRGRTSFSVDRHGPVWISAGKQGGGEPNDRVQVWLEDLEQLAAAPAAPPSGIQLLRSAARPGHEERALARFPRGAVDVLRTREGASLETAEVLRLRRGKLAWAPSRAADRLALHHFGGEEWAQHVEPWQPKPEPLRVLAEAGGVAAIGSPLVIHGEVYRGKEPRAALCSLELFPEREARWRDRLGEAPVGDGPRGSRVQGLLDPTSRLAQSSVGPVGSALPAPRRVFARGGLRAPGGLLQVEVPTDALAPGVYWARVEARREGSEAGPGEAGVTWARCEVRAPWQLTLQAPLHAVVGDEGEFVIELAGRAPAPTQLRWEAPGLALGEPRCSGVAPRLGVDPGGNALALTATSGGRVAFGFKALKPGAHALRFRLQAAGGGDLVEVRATLEVRPRGLWWWERQSGFVPSKGRQTLKLAMPRGVVPVTARLQTAMDPDLLTALLAGLGQLEAQPGGLRAPLEASLVRLSLPQIVLKRRLKTRVPAAPYRLSDLLQRSAALDSWRGPGPSLVVALLRLRAGGAPVPRSLIRSALRGLDPAQPRAAFALRLGGRPGAFPATPSGTLYRVLTLVETGGALPDELLAELLASEPSLEDPLERAELLALLVRLNLAAPLQVRLLREALLSRSGPAWEDPAQAGAVLRALAVLALRPPPNAGPAAKHLELPPVGVELRWEGKPLLKTWTGAGLERWAGFLDYPSRRLSPGARISLRTRETKAEVPYAIRAGGVVAEEAPQPRSKGLSVERSLSATSLKLGRRLRITLELSALPPGARLEVPLPGGCRLAEPRPDVTLREGVLHLEPSSRRVEIDLVTRHPGRYRVLPARVRARGGSWGTSGEAGLEIVR
jgi:hypothetical protein